MGGAARLTSLLTARFPPIRLSLILLHHRLSILSATPLCLNTHSSPPKTRSPTPQLNNSTSSIHSAALHKHHHQQQNHLPWPEWTKFLDILSNWQGLSAPEDHKILEEDAFVAFWQLSDELVAAASTCISFARARPDLLRLLSRRDIEAVVINGTPFLFKSALTTSRRMRAFLGTNASSVPVDRANTTDLMKYIITYAGTASVSSERNGLFSRELVDSSIRNLLLELGRICGEAPTGGDKHGPKLLRENIEMLEGDWICPKCDFMNFKKNRKCLRCYQKRPGRDWTCPQCKFHNFRRNWFCLKCQLRQPDPQPFEMKRGDWLCPKCDFPNFARKTTCTKCDQPIPWEQNGKWRCAQCNFFNYERDTHCSECECRRPQRRPTTQNVVEVLEILNIQRAATSEGPRMSFCTKENARLEDGSEVKKAGPKNVVEVLEILNIQRAAMSEGPRMSFCTKENTRLEDGSEVKEAEPLDLPEEARAESS